MAEAAEPNQEDFDFKNLKNKFLEQDKKVKKQKKKRDSVTKKGGTSNEEITNLKKKCEEYEKEIEQLKSAQSNEEEQAKEKAQLNAKIEELNEKITALTDENNEIKQKNQELEEEKANNSNESEQVDALKAQIAELDKQNDEFRKTIENGTSYIGQLEAKVKDLEAQNKELEEKNSSLQDDLKELETEKKSSSSTHSRKTSTGKLKPTKSPKAAKVKSPKAKSSSKDVLPPTGSYPKGKGAKRIINVKHPCIEIDIQMLDPENNELVLSGTLNFVLFNKERQKTVDNFLALMGHGPKKGNKNLKKKTYYGMDSLFHRIDSERGLIIGGDVMNGDGTGEAISIFGSTFNNEGGGKDIIDMAKYSLVMVQHDDADKDANGCQFMILMKPHLEWNGTHVCFGYMVDDISREFLDNLYLKGCNGDYIYKIAKKSKGVRYPLKNHLSKLGNSLM